MRAKPQVLVHAMGAETTEVLVVCSEHVGSAQELANAMPCSRSKYRFFRLVTRVLADSKYQYRAWSALGGELYEGKRSLLCRTLVRQRDLKMVIFFVVFADRGRTHVCSY